VWSVKEEGPFLLSGKEETLKSEGSGTSQLPLEGMDAARRTLTPSKGEESPKRKVDHGGNNTSPRIYQAAEGF